MTLVTLREAFTRKANARIQHLQNGRQDPSLCGFSEAKFENWPAKWFPSLGSAIFRAVLLVRHRLLRGRRSLDEVQNRLRGAGQVWQRKQPVRMQEVKGLSRSIAWLATRLRCRVEHGPKAKAAFLAVFENETGPFYSRPWLGAGHLMLLQIEENA
jgi:hypothetical protein